MSNKPVIVLIHGALTDASVWSGVASRLRAAGFTTIAPALPLRGLSSDAEYLSWFLRTIDGEFVLAGHSYGGSVISHPAVLSDHLKSLVFVAAFAPASRETTGELNGRWPGSKLGDATVVLRASPFGLELYLRPEHFAEVYANDLPRETVERLATAQRPLNTSALGESFEGQPTWKTKRSWTVIATNDDSLPVAAQRFMAARAGSTIVEVPASHACPLARPDVVAEAIARAAA